MMTGEQIIKALECCENNTCFGCPFYVDIGFKCKGADAQLIDLVNRQQAEIDRLQNDLVIWKDIAYRETSYVEKARVEAIKELTERLVAEKYYTGNKIGYGTYAVMVEDINNIAKKMIGDNK